MPAFETDLPLPESLAAWTVCPVCCGDVAPEVGEPGAQPHLVCHGRCGREWYANPKPTVNLFVEHPVDGRLLLVRRAKDPYEGYWDIPGGFLEEGEEAMSGALREIREETGLDATVGEFLGAFGDVYGTDRATHTVNLFWRATCADPDSAAPSSDAAEIGVVHARGAPAHGPDRLRLRAARHRRLGRATGPLIQLRRWIGAVRSGWSDHAIDRNLVP